MRLRKQKMHTPIPNVVYKISDDIYMCNEVHCGHMSHIMDSSNRVCAKCSSSNIDRQFHLKPDETYKPGDTTQIITFDPNK